MANETQARQARDRLLAEYEDLLGIRPRAVGIVASREGDYWVKITLPRESTKQLHELGGVRLEYDVAVAPAEFVSTSDAPWMDAIRQAQKRRAG